MYSVQHLILPVKIADDSLVVIKVIGLLNICLLSFDGEQVVGGLILMKHAMLTFDN